eukprot:m.22841 g.22841  ORF g.22841 m.22841 type:complete len:326 (-) comp10953_c0_seq1:44-1021(-)
MALRCSTALLRSASVAASISRRCMSSMDKQADSYYRAIDQAFFNFPIENIRFEVGEHFVSKNPHPMIFATSDAKEPGLLHASPFALSIFSYFGEKGNLGKKLGFGPGTVPDLESAEQEIGISAASLDGEGQNEVVLQYFKWLEAIQAKLLDHLLENSSAYPALHQKINTLKHKNYSEELLRQMISNDGSGLVKLLKDEGKNPIPGTEFLQFKQKVYYRASPEQAQKAKVYTAVDQDMLAKGYVRRHVPLYDSESKEVPLETARIQRDDIISVQSNITCNLYSVGGRVGFGLRRNLRSVVLLHSVHQTEPATSAPKSPFADVNLAQ